MERNWSKDQFIGYCLAHAVVVDGLIHPKEVVHLQKVLGLEGAAQALESIADETVGEQLQTIMKYKDHFFPDENQRAEVLIMISETFYADDEFSDIEKKAMKVLTNIFSV